MFDHNTAHTITEWKNYFLSSPQHAEVDSMFGAGSIAATNIHTEAWHSFIAMKYKKGQVVGVEAGSFDDRLLKYLSGDKDRKASKGFGKKRG